MPSSVLGVRLAGDRVSRGVLRRVLVRHCTGQSLIGRVMYVTCTPQLG
jgi:hypothetical protein